jgi:hypothetical protein
MLGAKLETTMIFAVYDPPSQDLPYLSVMVSDDGSVLATPFDTREDAEAHRHKVAAEAASLTGKDDIAER